jgi:phosphatidylglycerophosphatase A
VSAAGARRLLATAFGLGRLPAPGTAASAGTAAVIVLLCGLGPDGGPLPPRLQLAVLSLAVVAVCLLGVLLGNGAPRDFGSKDPGAFVLDEVAGQSIALLPLLPALSLSGVLLGFVLFRLLDIWKPWPIHRLEELPGGLGIMADDLAAGAIAAAAVAAARAAGWL